MICVIDYGAGNLRSVCNSLDFLSIENKISRDKDEILAADKVILPGVGSFGDAMGQLTKSGLINTIYDIIDTNKPFMGICLGMQMLFESSEESPTVSGLGIFKGDILKFPHDCGLKVPQIGWNSLDYVKPDNIYSETLNKYVYFVHSYYLKAKEEDIVACKSTYGVTFDAAISKGNVCASQFHPEKSGAIGLEIIKRFSTGR